MKIKLIIIAVISTCTFVLVAQQQRSSPELPSATAAPDAGIIAKLSEIVGIRERLARNYEEALRGGRASLDSLAEVELAEARVDLARERGRPNAIPELQNLVAAHERRTTRIAALPTDRITSGEIDRAQVALLEAQVRLLRAQK